MSKLHPVDRFIDLEERLRVLKIHIELVEKGDHCFDKSVREDLRVLIKNGKDTAYTGLLVEVAKWFGQVPTVFFAGMKGPHVPDTLSADRTVTFEEYLETQIVVDSTPMTYKDFIWKYASQSGSHSDPKPSRFVSSSDLVINGVDAKDLQVMCIARTVLSVGKALIQRIDKSNCPCKSGKNFRQCHGIVMNSTQAI